MSVDIKAREWIKDVFINVKHFGATGDGVTVDTTAFVNALNYCVANKKKLYIPNGTYILTGFDYDATDDIEIIGEDKYNTILSGMYNIAFLKNVVLKNFSIINSTAAAIIIINPSTGDFVNVYIEGLYTDNASYVFTNRDITDSFIYFSHNDIDKGIENVTIKNCDIYHYASYGIRLRGYVKRGHIENNFISDIGYDTSTSSVALLCGYYLTSMNAPANNMIIRDNIFKNIYSLNSESEDSVEAHFILYYGNNVTIQNNYCEYIYGGGKLSANLNCGSDHEAIYLKAYNFVIQGNIIKDACGNGTLNPTGAITVKNGDGFGSISNNNIYGTYGGGIYFATPNVSATNNIIQTVNGSVGIYADSINSTISNNVITCNVDSLTLYYGIFAPKNNYQIQNNIINTYSGIGIYIKDFDGSVNNNTIVGDKNALRGIQAYNTNNIQILNNKVHLIGNGTDVINASYGIYVQNNDSEELLRKHEVKNNLIEVLRPVSPSNYSTGLHFTGSSELTIQGNTVRSTVDYAIRISGINTNASILISQNNIRSIGGAILYSLSNSDGTGKFIFHDNDLYFSDPDSLIAERILYFDSATYIDYEQSENRWHLNDVKQYFIYINPQSYKIINERFKFDADCGWSYRFIRINSNPLKGIIRGNVVEDDEHIMHFIYYGTTSPVIGTVLIENNIVKLTSGSLINVNGETQISCTELRVVNNIIDTSSSNPIMVSASLPSSGYTFIDRYDTKITSVSNAIDDIVGYKWELIESVTVGVGGVTSIVREEEPDTTAYNFRAIAVKASLTAGIASEEIRVWHYFDLADLTKYLYSRIGSAIKTSVSSWCSWCTCDYGFWRISQTAATNSSSLITTLSTGPFSGLFQYSTSTYPNIKKVSITSQNAATPIPENSVIEIYGIR